MMFNISLEKSSLFKIYTIILLFAALIFPGLSKFIFVNQGVYILQTSYQIILLISLFFSVPLFFIVMIYYFMGDIVIRKEKTVEINYSNMIFNITLLILILNFSFVILYSFFADIFNVIGFYTSLYLYITIFCLLSFLGEYIWEYNIKRFIRKRKKTG